jgi:hypothetical protein
MSRFTAPLAAAAAAAMTLMAAPARAAPTYADTLVSQQFTTAFGSGLVTGAPDGGGRFLGDSFDPPNNPGNIVVRFTNGLTTGAGEDLFVVDVASSANETANVEVSPDNVTFTFVGTLNAIANGLDFGALYVGDFFYVRLSNASTRVSIDIDAVAGNFDAQPRQLPEPTTLSLVAATGLLMGALRRRGAAAR